MLITFPGIARHILDDITVFIQIVSKIVQTESRSKASLRLSRGYRLSSFYSFLTKIKIIIGKKPDSPINNIYRPPAKELRKRLYICNTSYESMPLPIQP